jgi:hypothetical protein
MPVQVLQFRPRLPRSSDWTQQEIAEFYRVESALLQAGLKLETERGVTDEGDPWFVFCREDTGEVFVHFARIDGEYVIDGAAYGEVARGVDFAALVRELMGSEVVAMARPRPKSSNVFLHPAALLIALVGAAFFHSGEAKAAEAHTDHRFEAPRRQGGIILVDASSGEKTPLGLDAAQQAAVMAGVIIGLEQQGALTLAFAGTAHETAPPPATDTQGPVLDALTPLIIASRIDAAPALSAADAAPAASAVHVSVALGALTFAQPGDQAAGPISISLAVMAAPPATATLAPPEALLSPSPAIFDTAAPAQAAAALPNDDAAAVVQALSQPGHMTIAVNYLPDVIAEAIGQGQHVSAAQPPAAHSDKAPPVTDAQPPASQAASGDAGQDAQPPATSTQPADNSGSTTAPPTTTDPGAGAAAASSTTTSGATTSAPTTPAVTPPAETTSTTAPPPVSHAHDPAIDAVVADFMASVHYQVMIAGQNLVVYDTGIFGKMPAGTVLDSVTFTFSDGSSVSLVGTAAELVEAHHLH